MLSEEFIIVFDVDGTLTDGKMYYTPEGKSMKAFGCDDWDMLKILHQYFEVYFVSADKKGFPISQKRISEEMGWNLSLVSHFPNKRLEWMREKAAGKKIVYVADGVFDGLIPKSNDLILLTTSDALEHVKQRAYAVMKHSGGSRAVAEACIWMLNWYGAAWERYINEQTG